MEKERKKEKGKILLCFSGICFLLSGLFYQQLEEEYKRFLLSFEYSKIRPYFPIIKKISQKYSLPPALVAAVIWQESKGNPYVVSPAGAIGLMQIMPSTGLRECGLSSKQLKDPYLNIECGCKILKKLYEKTGKYSWAVAQYYGGPKATPWSRFGYPPVYKYVRNVMKHFKNLSILI